MIFKLATVCILMTMLKDSKLFSSYHTYPCSITLRILQVMHILLFLVHAHIMHDYKPDLHAVQVRAQVFNVAHSEKPGPACTLVPRA